MTDLKTDTASFIPPEASPVECRLPQGVVVGLRQAAVCRFSAIPYAEPPVGERRFAPPVPSRWQGRLDATRHGPIAPQRRSRLADGMGEFSHPQDEDCLHLTVWTPAPDAARRPVLVWLHGGAWMSGAGALDWYDGSRLAARGDLVVVAPNARLGPLGWTSLPGGAVNAGLMDQSLALDWVLDHVAAFGGNPDDITLMGQSAGGMSVAQLIAQDTARHGRPRFKRAILQSPGLGRGFRSTDAALALGRRFMGIAAAGTTMADTTTAGRPAIGATTAGGEPPDGDRLAALRTLPAATLLDAMADPAMLAAVRADHPDQGLAYPVADATAGPDAAGLATASLDMVGFGPGQIPGPAIATLPVLIGYNRDEYTIFPGYANDERAARRGDEVYGRWSRAWVDAATARGGQAWLYRFDHGPNPRFGACHCAELPFVFGTLDAFRDAPLLAGGDPARMAALSDRMQQAWIRFIRGESPGWAPGPAPMVFG